MIKIHNCPRRSWKTRSFIQAMREYPTAIGVSTINRREFAGLYPKYILNRVFTVDDLKHRRQQEVMLGRRLIEANRTLYIDEAFRTPEETALLFYEAGIQGYNVEAWGTYKCQEDKI